MRDAKCFNEVFVNATIYPSLHKKIQTLQIFKCKLSGEWLNEAAAKKET